VTGDKRGIDHGEAQGGALAVRLGCIDQDVQSLGVFSWRAQRRNRCRIGFDSGVERTSIMDMDLKYGCNPHQGSAKLTVGGDPTPFRVLNGTPGYIG